jgi:sugar phosphate isomerase/epimerase
MQVQMICPYWGMESLGASEFMDRVRGAGYDGIEINVPSSLEFRRNLGFELDLLREEGKDFTFIAQQWVPPARESPAEYIRRMKARLYELVPLKPTFINSHTGKDYYSFDDNCRIIEACLHISEETGIPILHETHRGRFSFHAASLLPYLEEFPEIRLTADFSHWCVVSESLLEDQEALLERVIPHVDHIHARVGYEQGPQVNDPRSPEWSRYLERFLGWWASILLFRRDQGKSLTTLSPEFGPVPYMQAQPFTLQPVGNQWEINVAMKEILELWFRKS